MRGLPIAASIFALSSALACSSGGIESEDSTSPAVMSKPLAAQETQTPQPKPMRVLVTGFNDWRELGDPPNVWRCRDNPSCRLLVGAALDAQPSEFEGPLATRLRRRAPQVEWSFATMPVTWDAFASVPGDVEVVINIGLGVYDRFDALQLEAGAFNLREGVDAAGETRSGPIAAGAPQILTAPPASPITTRLDGLRGRTIAGYEVVVADARRDNSYLCNETHFHALSALHAQAGSLREVYFLHIPYAENGDYEALAEGVAGVVLGLTER